MRFSHVTGMKWKGACLGLFERLWQNPGVLVWRRWLILGLNSTGFGSNQMISHGAQLWGDVTHAKSEWPLVVVDKRRFNGKSCTLGQHAFVLSSHCPKFASLTCILLSSSALWSPVFSDVRIQLLRPSKVYWRRVHVQRSSLKPVMEYYINFVKMGRICLRCRILL